MQQRRLERYAQVPIRTMNVVVDLQDPFSPELPLEDFVKVFRKDPRPPRHRVLRVEVVSCVEDRQPVLVAECGRCERFVRRFEGNVCCRRPLHVDF